MLPPQSMFRHVGFVLLVALVVEHPVSAAPARAADREAAPPQPPTGPDKTVRRLASPLGCDRLTVAEGLPNSNVRAIVQDTRGFIWFGTQEGLVRYDGTKMHVYRPVEKDPTSLSSGYINALTLDAGGGIWIGTAEHGVNLYNPETDRFTRYGRGPGKTGLSSDGVSAIARDKKDRIWFAMSGGGVTRFDAATATFTHFATKPLDAIITSLAPDAAGNLWLGTASDGVIRWNPDTNEISQPTPADRSLAEKPINAILPTASGTVWMASDGEGLFAFDPAAGKFTRHRSAASDPKTISDDHVWRLFEDRGKNLWIGTTNGLNRMDAKGRVVRYQHDYNDPTSLSFNGVEAILQDAGGVMWIGGSTVGACKFDESRLKFGYHRTQNNATAILQDPDGTLWVGTYNGGLYKFERAAQRVTLYHELRGSEDGSIPLEAGSWITALHRDRRGTLWMAVTGRGLIAFDTTAETYRVFEADPDTAGALPTDVVFDMWEDDKGLLWLATWGAGLVRFDPQAESFTGLPVDTRADSTDISSHHIYTLYPDPSDKALLWIGTAKGGLVRYNLASGTATSFRHRSDDPATLSNDDVTSIYREPSGIVWAGTYGAGLNRLDPATGKVERFTSGNSALPNNTVFGLHRDADGMLWLGTNGGLVRLDPKTRTFFVFDTTDGLQDTEFSQGGSLQGAAGELFFGGTNGFNAFFPREIKRDDYVPPLVATAFKVFNQDVALERPMWMLPPLEVSYTDSFEVQFAALAFAAPKKNRYAYKLDGFDSDFVETDRPYAAYTKLDGGNYTLRVRAANRHGTWNEQAIAIAIAVRPPWWRTWHAYGVYLIVFAGAIYLLFRTQRQRVLRAEREGRLAVVERDLELTGAVQSGFLPEHNEITTARVNVFGLYRPADACGGDWWWHEPLSGGRHVIMVGDVTGHGPGPAMVTAAVATAFRVLIENGLDDMRQALEMLNREVLRVAKGKYHMTMVAFEIDEATGWWVCHNAGAPPLMSLDQNGKHKVHFCPGAPLGTESGFETGRVEGKLDPADRILMYTDGIPEIALANGNVFGTRRLAQLFERTRGQDLKGAATTILLQADQSRSGQAQADDWTFAMIEWS